MGIQAHFLCFLSSEGINTEKISLSIKLKVNGIHRKIVVSDLNQNF